mgnify:FL=1
MKILSQILKSLLIFPIKLYKWIISPLLGNNCRHTPSCSKYSIDAIKTHGAFWGFLLACGRILRCNPWGTHGYDPVPPANLNSRQIWKLIRSRKKYQDQDTIDFENYDISKFYKNSNNA